MSFDAFEIIRRTRPLLDRIGSMEMGVLEGTRVKSPVYSGIPPTTVIENGGFLILRSGSGSAEELVSARTFSSGIETVCVEVEPMTLLLSPQEKMLGGPSDWKRFRDYSTIEASGSLIFLNQKGLRGRERVSDESLVPSTRVTPSRFILLIL